MTPVRWYHQPLTWWLLAIAFLIAGIVWLAFNVTDERGDACRAAGGIVKSSTKSATGINPSDGKPVITTITINACVNKEGNVTDVW
jgi:hypothetical protein